MENFEHERFFLSDNIIYCCSQARCDTRPNGCWADDAHLLHRRHSLMSSELECNECVSQSFIFMLCSAREANFDVWLDNSRNVSVCVFGITAEWITNLCVFSNIFVTIHLQIVI